MSSQKSFSQKSKHSTSKKNVQNELREFYRVAKENLLNLKNEVDIAEQQYIAQKEEAERRMKADNVDFRGAEMLANRIIYNNE